MDKIAANNHFVALKKEIKKAKNMVSGNLVRKIVKLKEEGSKTSDAATKSKIESKIASTLEDMKNLKTIDSYIIAKRVTLKPDVKYWDKVISDSKASSEDILMARVMTKNNVQKQVAKFRQDHKDCDEWLNEYIEYREKKREIVMPAFKKGNKTRGPKASFDKKDRHPKSKSGPPFRNNQNPRTKDAETIDQGASSGTEEDSEALHPSWASKRREKELLKAALGGEIPQPKRIVLNKD